MDALDVSGNSLLDDSIPYFVEVRGWGGVRRQAHMRACVRAGVSACAHTRADVCSAHALLRFASRLLWQALSKPSVKTKELVLAGNNLAGNGALPVGRRRTGGRFRGTREPRPHERDRGGARRGAWPYIDE